MIGSVIPSIVVISDTVKEKESILMLCERCGKELPVDALTCPNCGTATRAAQSMPSGYPSQQSGYMPPPQSGYMPPPQPGPGYTPPPQQPGYMPPPQP